MINMIQTSGRKSVLNFLLDEYWMNLDPKFKTCFFEDKILHPFWSRFSILWRLINTVLFFLAIICKPYVQHYLWIFITGIYIPAMYVFDSIGDEYVLINPKDAASSPKFDFGAAVYNCSSAPPGHPILLNYSYQIVSGWYDVLVYAFTIGFTVRGLSANSDWLRSLSMIGLQSTS